MNPLLVALDVDTAAEARQLAAELRGAVGGFKIGNQLFTSVGPSIVEELVGRGDRVFLDLKFHDIPNTVAGAVRAAARLGVWMLNVHAAGGSDMLRAARAAADDEAARLSRPPTLVIAVTILTSLNETKLTEIGFTGSMAAHVKRFAELARATGLDGVVASPLEISMVRTVCGSDFVIVTPGIRDTGGDRGDQARTATAAEALANGASYVVVGRPITAAANPRTAAERLLADCHAV